MEERSNGLKLQPFKYQYFMLYSSYFTVYLLHWVLKKSVENNTQKLTHLNMSICQFFF